MYGQTSENHGIIKWFGLVGTLEIIWFQPPCHEQGHLPLDQAAQSSIQPAFEHCQGGGSHNFSGQPVPVFDHPHGEELCGRLSLQIPQSGKASVRACY